MAPPAGIRFLAEERPPKRTCTSPNFEVRVTENLIKKLEKAQDHNERLRILGDAMRATSRVILPGEWEQERDGIYERLSHELGLPKPPVRPQVANLPVEEDVPCCVDCGAGDPRDEVRMCLVGTPDDPDGEHFCAACRRKNGLTPLPAGPPALAAGDPSSTPSLFDGA